MNRLLLIVILFYSSYSQGQWSFTKAEDPFNGNELIVIGRGYGGDSPYENPRIVFRQNLKENELDVYIDGSGYSGCDNNRVDFSFGNSDEVLSFSGYENINRDVVFLRFSIGDESFLNLNTLIKKLKSKSIVYVEVRNRCMRNRFNIRLSGSSGPLSKGIGNFMYEGVKELQELKVEKERKLKEIEDKIRLKEEREAELERNRKESLAKKKAEEPARKKIKYDSLFKDINGIIIKPSISAMDEIMKEQFINYSRPPLNRLKSGHSMLDIDRISLSPTSISCVYNLVVYDYDLPIERQAYLSTKKISLNQNTCDVLKLKTNNNVKVYEIIRIDDKRIKRGSGEIIITDNSVEFNLPETENLNLSDYGKQFFSSYQYNDYSNIYYFPTSKRIKRKSVWVSSNDNPRTIKYLIETASPYTYKEIKYLVKEKK